MGKTVLITGYEPFGGQSINPSWMCVRELPDEMEGCRIIKRELPVVWGDARDRLEKLIDEFNPISVMCCGQAGGCADIIIERVAVNLCHGVDNNGVGCDELPVFEGGPVGYFASLPAVAMCERVKNAGIKATLSYSAGTYLCNYIMYSALHMAATARPGMMAGFVHVPFLPEQNPQGHSMDFDTMLRGVRLCAETVCRDAAWRRWPRG